MAPELVSLRIADDPQAWVEAGFAVRRGITTIEDVSIELAADEAARGILGWSLTGVDVDTVDGLAVVDAPVDTAPSEPHPNGSNRIDHLVAASPDLPRTVSALEALGLDVRRTRDTDQYGGPMRQVFFRLGRPLLELIGPTEPMDDRPASFWGLAITVDDLDATKDLLGDHLGDPKDAVQPGRRIATLRHKAFDITVPIAFMSA